MYLSTDLLRKRTFLPTSLLLGLASTPALAESAKRWQMNLEPGVTQIGQEIYDLLGVRRENTDRIRNIAHLGVSTFGWTFVNRKEAVPEPVPYVRLIAPSGAIWEWGSPSDDERVDGAAEEFCQVVCQTRNIADTKLQATGTVAAQWMAVAQCFAGPPEDPPLPGSRSWH